MLLAHLFEEISVLALRRLIPEALLCEAFAFDLSWGELREDVLKLRAATGNEEVGGNFELAAERAREYRGDRLPKKRWRQMDDDSGPSEPPGGLGGREPDQPPTAAPSNPVT